MPLYQIPRPVTPISGPAPAVPFTGGLVSQPDARYWRVVPTSEGSARILTGPQVTLGPSFEFKPNQPELVRYQERQRLRFVVDAEPQIDQGAPKQQRYEFVPNQPELRRFADRQALRFVVDAPAQLHQGATRQPSYEFTPNQPELARWAQRERARILGGSPLRVEGATVQPWYVFPVQQPTAAAWAAQWSGVRQSPGPESPLDTGSAPPPPVDVFRVLDQPVRAIARQQPIAAWLLDTPTAGSYLFSVSQPVSRRRFQLPRPKPPIDVTVAPSTQTDLYPVNQPDLSRWLAREQARALGGPVPQTSGATVQAGNFVFPVPQPVRDYYGRDRMPAPTTTLPILGPTVTTGASYEFPVNQPNLTAWLARERSRTLGTGSPYPRTEGATIQQTYVFPVSEPDARFYVRNTFAETKVPIAGAAVVVAQSYEFKVSTPEFRFYAPDAVRYARTGSAPQIDTGATRQQTYIFPVNQPELQAFHRLQLARSLGGSVAYPLDTFATLIVIRPAVVVWEARATYPIDWIGSSNSTTWQG
jgi:hypothetical protein